MQHTDPRVVVVAGGTGNIGEGIVRAALRTGATVVVPSRSRQRLNALERYVTDAGVDRDALRAVQADVGSFDGARDFVTATVSEFGRLDLSIASLGGWWAGPALLETSELDWRKVMGDNLDAHYTYARHAIPAMGGHGGVHVLIGGPGNLLANPRSTLITIAGHAQLTLAQLLDAEASGLGVRAYQLFVAGIFDRQRGRGDGELAPTPGVVTPDEIGDKILKLYRERPGPTVQKLFAQPVPGFPL